MTAIDMNSCTVSTAREAVYLQGETEEGGKVSREHQQVERAAEKSASGFWEVAEAVGSGAACWTHP